MSEENQQPVFNIQRIYLKDLSLEQPNSPSIFLEQEGPGIEVAIDIGDEKLSENIFESTITITITAKIKDKVAFLIECKQAGIFEASNIPEGQLEPLLGIACPNILYPYLRANIAEADYWFNAFQLMEGNLHISSVIADARARIIRVLPQGITISSTGNFINFNVSNELLSQTAGNIAENPSGGITPAHAKTMVEYFSPNTNKPAHLGHLRNLTLGKSLSATLAFLGHDVIQANLTNDRGAHICKSMLAYQMFGEGSTPE